MVRKSITRGESQPDERLMGVSSSALDIVRHLYTVRPELCSMVTVGNAHVVLETRWGLGLSSGDLPEENVVRYSLIQYTGGMRP